ncbi:AAA family ATPase [Klebsiella pneumoniae]|uniref:AAA family ATPase n=1 Tax=Klebsiella pneumoniae TaxID=573 RepID=UPI000B3EA60B|nr:AAA family ATPase [Klebsiella pneumoniae]MBS2837233.1 AAA family ATPase [Klebsiella pneumoniae]MCX9984811.1 AAA family ATPase [Klebsiella pneumoniae]MCY0000455.1 AAA family ATPase [Klebsiella pneumoniae]MDE4811230.1 AAA family ATPase [Klebsiella pneumoniae]OUY62298.1 anticodon nuclease [Klebsiella pneumoniae]
MSFETIAQELKDVDENIVLIYAFNGTGKTQLSVAYKNLTKAENNDEHAGVYYNAYSEDLFFWDNDEENDGANVRLKILPSSLNRFHSFLYEDEQAVANELALYNPKFKFQLNPYDDLEKGLESVTFYKEGEDGRAIKISRGEERIFVWCFFLALLEVDGWANAQNAHIFIDDPVSSQDEHNIFITADTVFRQVEQHYEKKRIIITTHHIGLFSILANRLTKGEKSGRYKNLTAIRILKRTNDELHLVTPNRNVFLYHLHLLQVLDEASKSQLYTYHFALLRQLLENIASFLGTGRANHTLSEIGIQNTEEVMNVVNAQSHKSVYYDQTEMMSQAEQSLFTDILNKLVEKYHFQYFAGRP